MNTTINISVVPGREYRISSANLSTLQVYYNNMLVAGANLNNRFVALAGVNTLVIVSPTVISGTITVTEYLRNFYNPQDGQGGMLAFNERWLGIYGFRPEWMGSVGNRLVTFLGGIPYIHSGAKNSFYGQTQDSVVSFPHNEGGNTIKVYNTLAIEGDTPDRVHVRTEKPYVQSSDLVSSEFRTKEGVPYAAIYRDRLSPNVTGTYESKLLTGDRMRGDLAKFQVVFSQPSTQKQVKFVDINYNQSTGQTV